MNKYEQSISYFKAELDSIKQLSDECALEQPERYDVRLVLDALEKQVPKKPYTDNENGEYEKDYCPTCHSSLFPNCHHCRCGQAVDWGDVEWEID